MFFINDKFIHFSTYSGFFFNAALQKNQSEEEIIYDIRTFLSL